MKNKKIYYTKSCSTCKRIISELKNTSDVVFQDLKQEKITAQQLEELANIAGSYEKIFSRVAMKYRIMGLQNVDLKEADFKKLMLEEYTFIKRPVVVSNGKIFIGSARATIEALKKEFSA
jgi:arsenate reductase (glutaredoxin)